MALNEFVTAPGVKHRDEADILGTLIGRLGKDDTFKIVEAYGGTRVYIPYRFSETSPIATEIGVSRATMLIPFFAGNIITIPVARGWKVTVYRERGMSTADIAIKLGVHEDTVRRLLKQAGLGGRRSPDFETVQIDRGYWSGLSAILHNTIPRGVPAPWPLAVQAATLMDIVTHIDRDLLGLPAPDLPSRISPTPPATEA